MSQNNSKKVLTPDLVLVRSKSDCLANVKNLNLWGNELSDITVLRDMPNVEVLSLSINKISSLKEFQYCPKLTELYLRKNEIGDLSEVRYLENLRQLRVLWLCDNPCAEHQLYRQFVISRLPNLVKLDNQDISSEERESAQQVMSANPRFLKEMTEGAVEQPVRRSEVEASPAPSLPPVSRAPGSSSSSASSASSSSSRHSPAPTSSSSSSSSSAASSSSSRSDNILCAVLALMKELDDRELELIMRECEKRIGRM